jgi:hypothetical protein
VESSIGSPHHKPYPPLQRRRKQCDFARPWLAVARRGLVEMHASMAGGGAAAVGEDTRRRMRSCSLPVRQP